MQIDCKQHFQVKRNFYIPLNTPLCQIYAKGFINYCFRVWLSNSNDSIQYQYFVCHRKC